MHGSWGPNDGKDVGVLGRARRPGGQPVYGPRRLTCRREGGAGTKGLSHSENNQPGLAALQREQEDPRL